MYGLFWIWVNVLYRHKSIIYIFLDSLVDTFLCLWSLQTNTHFQGLLVGVKGICPSFCWRKPSWKARAMNIFIAEIEFPLNCSKTNEVRFCNGFGWSISIGTIFGFGTSNLYFHNPIHPIPSSAFLLIPCMRSAWFVGRTCKFESLKWQSLRASYSHSTLTSLPQPCYMYSPGFNT